MQNHISEIFNTIIPSTIVCFCLFPATLTVPLHTHTCRDFNHVETVKKQQPHLKREPAFPLETVNKPLKQKPTNPLIWGRIVQRRDVIQLLREIGSYPEVTPFTCVYLKPRSRTGNDGSENLELHVKTNRDASTRQIIERLALKHRLIIEDEPGGFLGIYTPERKLLEITA
jgi:hypothetical protein